MQRRDFLKQTSLSILSLPFLGAFTSYIPEFSKNDLLGKSTPLLYGKGYRLQKEAHKAFFNMKKAAAKEGINLQVVSSYRSYAHQKRIWERKYKRFTKQGLSPIQAIEKIIQYSTIPGTSRHHWGTDLDIIDGNQKRPKSSLLQENFESKGVYYKQKIWMDKHAQSYGFYLVYTSELTRKGFKYEPWHYTYAPLSIPMLKAYKNIDIHQELQQSNVLGSQYFSEEFIKKYIFENILDINPSLV